MIENGKEMQLWEHLEELRWTIFKVIGVLTATTVIALFFVDDILKLFMYPIEVIQINNPDIVIKQILTGPFDAVLIKMKMGFLAGLIVGLPFVLYFIWSFIRSGLEKKEKRAVIFLCISGTVSFLVGITLGYLLIIPVLSILLKYSISSAENLWTIKSFINFVFYWELGAGLIFELPFVMVIFAKVGIISVSLLKKLRPYFYVGAFIIAAIITPPDPFTMIVVGIPLVLLYEAGILIASLQNKSEISKT